MDSVDEKADALEPFPGPRIVRGVLTTIYDFPEVRVDPSELLRRYELQASIIAGLTKLHFYQLKFTDENNTRGFVCFAHRNYNFFAMMARCAEVKRLQRPVCELFAVLNKPAITSYAPFGAFGSVGYRREIVQKVLLTEKQSVDIPYIQNLAVGMVNECFKGQNPLHFYFGFSKPWTVEQALHGS